MPGWASQWICLVRARLRRRRDLLLEHLVLRHQLAVLERTGTGRPYFYPSERLFWVVLSRWWTDWQRGLIIVQPATVLRWRRRGLRAGWKSGSRGRWRGGRPRIDSEIRALVVRMAHENFLWGAPRIHGELLKLGFDVSQATVSRYMPRRSHPPFQTWRTFLQNQALGIGMIGFPEATRTSHQLLTRARRRIERVVRCAAEFRQALSCWPIKPSPTLHPLRSSDACDLADRRTIYGAPMPVGFVLDHAYWPTARVRPLPYRSRASPAPTLPALVNFAQTSRTCRRNSLVSRHQFALPVCGGLLVHVQTVARG